jgi:hypothetical protein
MTINKPADRPEFTVCRNASRPHLVHISIGTGQLGYDISPELAVYLGYELLAAAHDIGGDDV